MIYFAINKTTDLIKIGYSANVVQRIQSLRGKKNDVVLLGCMLGDRDRERQMHEWFFCFHHNGEWFHNAPEIVSFVEKNRIAPRLIVAEHARIQFTDDYRKPPVPQELINRLVALANEKRMNFADLALQLLETGILEQEQALDERDKNEPSH